MAEPLRSVYLDSKLIATLIPISAYFSVQEKAIVPDRKYILSRFAYAHRSNDQVILECSLSHSRITLDHWLASAVIHVLGQPASVQEICQKIPSLTNVCASEFMNLLLNASMLWEINDDGNPEDLMTNLRSWEFHDLLFHSRSRGGRHDHLAGGTMRFAGKFDPPPILKKVEGTRSIDLYRPDMEKLQKEDPPYAFVQEDRCSIRDYSEDPISDMQLGEFLYRVGRVADYWKIAFDSPQGTLEMSAAPRPYPAAGGLYELELNVVVNRCEKLESGLYYYDPENHRLIEISNRTSAVEQFLNDAGRSTGISPERLQILIIVSARFQRIAWKYSTLAYAAILKNLGVLYQTMYLTATAMGLAPCAIGYGDSDLFASAAGTEYYSETSVGEFLLGTRQS